MTVVSVIVPLYNQKQFLSQSVQSALAQTLIDIEVIVIDDGSEEDVEDLIRSFNDNRVKLVKQDNAGVAIARNRAIEMANSEYLAFVDADDWIEPTMLEELVDILNHDLQAGFAYCDIKRVNKNGDLADEHRVRGSRREMEGDLLPSLLVGGYFPPVSVVARTALVKAVGSFDRELGGCCDWDLWLRMACTGATARFHDAQLAAYRLHDQSMSKNSAHMRQMAIATLAKNFAAHPSRMANAIQTLIDTSGAIYVNNKALHDENLSLSAIIAEQKAAIENSKHAQELKAVIAEKDAYISSLLEGKAWLETQWQNYVKENEAKDLIIQQLLARTNNENEYKMSTMISRILRQAKKKFRKSQYDLTGANGSGHNFATASDDTRDLILASGYFDETFYRGLYIDLDVAGFDVLTHYIEHGGFEGRRAHPEFDAQAYFSAYPDVKESGLHPLIHFLTIGKAEGRSAGPARRLTDLAGKAIQSAAALEPSILLDTALDEPRLLDYGYAGKSWRGLTGWRKLFESLQSPYTHMVFVPWLVRGGADLAAVNAFKAITEKHGLASTLIVLTDFERKDSLEWLPEGAHIRILSDYGTNLDRLERMQMLEALILAVRPRAVLNVNSGACWELIVQRGSALRKATQLYAFLFCRDFNGKGQAAGYSDTHFKEALPYLTKVYFDNTGFLNELSNDFGVPASLRSKMVPLYQPIKPLPDICHTTASQRSNAVIWAGRFSAQKNVDLLLEIVSGAPELAFDVYGYGDSPFQERMEEAESHMPNLTLKGGFASTSALPLQNYVAFLYTSLWDGLPLTLAEIASSGIPMVASAVGGIPELVTPESGWLIQAVEDPQAYIDALRAIHADPEQARHLGARLAAAVASKHSWAQFNSSLALHPSFME